MRREGEIILFDLCDHRRVNGLPDEIDAAQAPDIFKATYGQQADLAVDLYILQQRGVGAAEQTVAQERVHMRVNGLEAFRSDLGKIAPDEIARVLAEELAEAVYGPALDDE